MTQGNTNLWAPWRIGYIQGLESSARETSRDSGAGCFLCAAADNRSSETDRDDQLVLLRDERGVLMLNRYPYTNGHLLAGPLDHVADLSDLAPEARAGLMELAELGGRLLRKVMNPQGLNIGINLGRCAGAGVPGHLHMHIVPRWHGDVNFMDVVGGVRVIPQAIEESFAALKGALDAG